MGITKITQADREHGHNNISRLEGASFSAFAVTKDKHKSDWLRSIKGGKFN